MKPLYKIHKTLLKNSANFLLLLYQKNWQKICNIKNKFQEFLTSHNETAQSFGHFGVMVEFLFTN